MEEGLDTGPVLIAEPLDIGPGDTSGSLHASLAKLGAGALIRALEGVAAGTLEARAQPAAGTTYATRIAKAEGRIDWSRDALAIERQVRAFNPWPVAETTFAGEQLRIHAARAAREPASASIVHESGGNSIDPGMIVAVRDGNMLVRCGQGHLEVLRVQRPGGKVIAAGDFAHSVNVRGERLG
jgi:methionyl-tRNA formyltransferase